MKILVTGATGFIGSNLCKKLVNQKKHQIIGLYNQNSMGLDDIIDSNHFNLIKCDIVNYDDVFNVIGTIKPDIIIHTAALLLKFDHSFSQYYKVNVEGTFNILESMKTHHVEKIIYSSSMQVYGKPQYLPIDEKHTTNPSNMYGLTKLIGEMLCKTYYEQYGIKSIILRYSGVFGPNRNNGAIYNFITSAIHNNPLLIYSDGTDTWDTIYVDDAVIANIQSIKNIDKIEFNIFNIGCGQKLEMCDVAKKICKMCSSKSKIIVKYAEEPINFYYDISKAVNYLEFQPSSLDKSLSNYLQYFT